MSKARWAAVAGATVWLFLIGGAVAQADDPVPDPTLPTIHQIPETYAVLPGGGQVPCVVFAQGVSCDWSQATP